MNGERVQLDNDRGQGLSEQRAVSVNSSGKNQPDEVT